MSEEWNLGNGLENVCNSAGKLDALITALQQLELDILKGGE